VKGVARIQWEKSREFRVMREGLEEGKGFKEEDLVIEFVRR